MRKAFICPTKYVQGEDELLNLGYFVSTYGKTALLIAHPDDANRVKEKLDSQENVPEKKLSGSRSWHWLMAAVVRLD